MTSYTKQFMATQQEWIASSLSLPCANASRLLQAMTVETEGANGEKGKSG
jgi:hypothetical protein